MADYAVKARTARGWQIVHWTDSAAKADAWIAQQVRENGTSYTDYTVKRIEK